MNTCVNTKYGQVNGKRENGLLKWLGVPYAKPPVGKLSFKRAQNLDAWDGVKECTQFPNRPIQYSLPFKKTKIGNINFSNHSKKKADTSVQKTPESKDCLYLNIWRKDNDAENLPVMVWFYGGAFIMGDASYPAYDGVHFAEDGVLTITINYRVGIYGIYDFSFYNKELFDSNCALSDQIMALKWIQNNIRNFGGDPNNITIAGESAGGTSVANLLAAPDAKELFQKAIIESSSVSVQTKSMTKFYTDLFLKHIGLTGKEIEKLIEMDPESTKEALTDSQRELYSTYPGIIIPGMELDDLLPEDPVSAIRNGSAADKKLIIGTNKNEASLFYKLKIVPTTWKKIGEGYEAGGCKEKFKETKGLYASAIHKAKSIQEWLTDRYFLAYSIQIAAAQSKYNDVWMYQFDAASKIMKRLGLHAMHSAEIPFVFATTDIKTHETMLWTGASEEFVTNLKNEIHTYWTNFIKSGNPNADDKDTWTKYDSDVDNIMIFDEKSGMKNRNSKEKLAVWCGVNLYCNL